MRTGFRTTVLNKLPAGDSHQCLRTRLPFHRLPKAGSEPKAKQPIVPAVCSQGYTDFRKIPVRPTGKQGITPSPAPSSYLLSAPFCHWEK